MGVDRYRVCELYAAGPDGEASGSGYRLGDRLVLTACHVIAPALAGAGGRVLVRPVGVTGWPPARVEWADAEVDAALIGIEDEHWRTPGGESVLRWGGRTRRREMNDLVEMDRPVDGVSHLILNRPEKLNALSLALLSKLVACLRTANDDPSVGCVVLSGRGRAFSAGADIADQHAHGEKVVFDPGRLSHWHEIESFPKPLVAAATGYVLGGGNELAMLADVIIAGDDARFGQPEIKIGIFPGDGGTQRLVRAVGKSMAMQMILTGEPIDAAAALRAGLVSEVVPTGHAVERAVEVGRLIARHSPIATRTAKRSVLYAFQSPLNEGLDFERAIFAEAFASEDRREGMAAFLERRPPRFSGR